MSFAIQYLCAVRLWKQRGKLSPGVHAVPGEVDELVARAKLRCLGSTIDRLTPEQEHYIRSWQEGT
jgi:adenosylhomocysteinase